MKRAEFLRRLVAGAAAVIVAPQALEALAPVAARKATIGPIDVYPSDYGVLPLMRSIAWPALRYDVPQARIVRLRGGMGDHQHRLVVMQGRSGVWARKAVAASDTRELAYQLVKATREVACDIAYHEGVDYRKHLYNWRHFGV